MGILPAEQRSSSFYRTVSGAHYFADANTYPWRNNRDYGGFPVVNVNNLNNESTAMSNVLCTIPSPEALLSFLRQENQPPDEDIQRANKAKKTMSRTGIKWKYSAMLSLSIH